MDESDLIVVAGCCPRVNVENTVNQVNDVYHPLLTARCYYYRRKNKEKVLDEPRFCFKCAVER